jgi:uncharacterized protein
MMTFIGLGLGIGLVMGLTGAGGGILAVPALVGLLGWSMQQAAPVALIAVAGGALTGAIDGLRRGLARWRAALLMAAVGIACSSLGLYVARLLPEVWVKAVFSAVLLFAAWRMLFSREEAAQEAAELALSTRARIHPETGRFVWTPRTAVLLSVLGATMGFASGLLGVGGGFVLVPLLRRFTHLSMHGIVATSLMVIALVSSGGVLAALAQGAHVPMPATAVFALGSIAGVLLGRLVVHRLPAAAVRRVFALLLIAVAVSLVVKALSI